MRARIDTLRTSLSQWLKFDPDREIPSPGPILLFILCVGLVLRLAAAWTMSAIDLDGTIYAQIGEAFSRGAVIEALRGVFPPFYPFLIGVAHLFIPDLEIAGSVVSLTASLLLIYLSFVFFRRVMGDTKALYVAFFVAINPYMVKYSASVLTESTATLLVLVTVFTFYRSWTGGSPVYAALSGFCLSLTYLTRPEYIAYSLPLFGLLVVRKKFLHAFLFALFFAILAGAYIYWMKTETGLLVFSKKAIMAKNTAANPAMYHSYLLPMFSLMTVIKHIPRVLYDMANALLPHFVILALAGIFRVDRRYTALAIILVLFHMAAPSAMAASSKRLYVELIPLVLPFSVAGLSLFLRSVEKFRPGKMIYYLCVAGIIGVSLAQCYSPPSTARALNKQAGLYISARDPHRVVASVLPLVPFYAKGEWRFLPYLARGTDTCPAFIGQMRDKGIDYAAIDEEMEKISPFVSGCLKPLPPMAEFRRGDEFVRLYKIREK